MRALLSGGAAFLMAICTPAVAAGALEIRPALQLEARVYTQSPDHTVRFDDHYALGLEIEFQQGSNNGDTVFTFVPFARWDSEDEARRHFDIRELNILHAFGNWETLVGVGKVFWGVTESSHLVDVINQTDFLEGIDGEDKLGQPMLRLGYSFDQSVLTGFILPGFREREYLSVNNPIGLPVAVSDKPVYQSDQGDDHIDYAVRYSGYRGMMDYGVSWFHGTSRDPRLLAADTGRLTPYYPQIDQFGVDIQITGEAWLWKLEMIRRIFSSNNPISANDFTAYVGGFEYSFYGMAGGLFDLGLLAEYHRDSRADRQTVIFQNDLFLGTRLGFNDAESSEVLFGGFIDRDDDTTSFRLEAGRRIFTDARINLEAQAFSNVAPGNIGFSLRNSDFVLLSLEFYF